MSGCSTARWPPCAAARLRNRSPVTVPCTSGLPPDPGLCLYRRPTSAPDGPGATARINGSMTTHKQSPRHHRRHCTATAAAARRRSSGSASRWSGPGQVRSGHTAGSNGDRSVACPARSVTRRSVGRFISVMICDSE